MKKIISLLLALCIVLSFGIVAFADDSVSVPGSEPESVVEPRIEETEWVYRVLDGYIIKRLWSNTYGKWLTDWIVVGPAP